LLQVLRKFEESLVGAMPRSYCVGGTSGEKLEEFWSEEFRGPLAMLSWNRIVDWLHEMGLLWEAQGGVASC
jgi:hypothetical protein